MVRERFLAAAIVAGAMVVGTTDSSDGYGNAYVKVDSDQFVHHSCDYLGKKIALEGYFKEPTYYDGKISADGTSAVMKPFRVLLPEKDISLDSGWVNMSPDITVPIAQVPNTGPNSLEIETEKVLLKGSVVDGLKPSACVLLVDN